MRESSFSEIKILACHVPRLSSLSDYKTMIGKPFQILIECSMFSDEIEWMTESTDLLFEYPMVNSNIKSHDIAFCFKCAKTSLCVVLQSTRVIQ